MSQSNGEWRIVWLDLLDFMFCLGAHVIASISHVFALSFQTGPSSWPGPISRALLLCNRQRQHLVSTCTDLFCRRCFSKLLLTQLPPLLLHDFCPIPPPPPGLLHCYLSVSFVMTGVPSSLPSAPFCSWLAVTLVHVCNLIINIINKCQTTVV